MTQIIALIIFLSFPLWFVIIVKIFETVYLWQVKEYRLDRVLSHYKYEGSLSLNDEFELIIRITILVTLAMYAISPLSIALGIAVILVLVYYDLKALKDLSRLMHKKMHRPSLKSPRNLLILLLVGIIYILPYLYIGYLLSSFGSIEVYQNVFINNLPELSGDVLFSTPLATQADGVTIISLPLFVTLYSICAAVLLDLFVALIVPVMAFITSPISILKRKMLIAEATRKMQDLPNIKVIAVTGSYGKTTTKEIIAQILGKKYRLIKTEKHNNTEVGIAKTILAQANKDIQIFVAEMGAYKIGETAACARIAKPNVAIITGIDEQHMSLYGNFKNILDSTMEVVDELTEDGTVILNGDNDYCVRLAEKIDHRKRLYFTNERSEKLTRKSQAPIDENLYVSGLEEDEKGLSFGFVFDGEIGKIKTNITAKHNAGNISAAIITAVEMGVSVKEVCEIINGIKFELPYLSVKDGQNGAKLIDDGYNINPSGYYAGLKFLAGQATKGRKWVLTQGFIELGDEKESTYQKVAAETIKNSGGIISSDLELCAEISEQLNPQGDSAGGKPAPDFRVVYVDSVFDIPLFVKRDVAEGDIVLIEGPLPGQVLDKIYLQNKQ